MGVIDERGMPIPSYKKDYKAVSRHLKKSYTEMLEYLLLQLAFNPDSRETIRQAQIMRQINFYLKQLDEQMHKDIEKTIKKAFEDGQAYHLLSVGAVDTWNEAVESSTFNQMQRGRVTALINDTYDDILLATDKTAGSVKQVVRETVRDVAQYHSLQNNGYEDQAKDLQKRLTKKGLSEKITKEGFVGIVDKAGRRWNLGTYSKMVVKTKTNQAFTEGIMMESEETGFDLAVISDHGAEDACSKWEGVVISLHGKTEGYPTYSEARATNEIWHPNCEHSLHSIRNLDMLHEDDVATHKKKLRELGNYQQRVYKRK